MDAFRMATNWISDDQEPPLLPGGDATTEGALCEIATFRYHTPHRRIGKLRLLLG